MITKKDESIPENSKWDKVKDLFSGAWDKLFPQDKRIRVKPVTIYEDAEITKNRAIDIIYIGIGIFNNYLILRAIIEIIKILTNYLGSVHYPF